MVIKRTDFNYFLLMCIETPVIFVVLKIFCKFYTFGKSNLECFPNQNLSFNGNLCQVAPVNLALVDVKEERSHAE